MLSTDNNKPIIVKYTKAKTECRCCGRSFENPEYGEEKEFEITLQNVFHWAQWREVEDIYDEDLEQMVEEYLWDTIHFYACDTEDKLQINEDDVKTIIQMVKATVLNIWHCGKLTMSVTITIFCKMEK